MSPMTSLFLLLALFTTLLNPTSREPVGVCYGMLGNNLPSQSDTIALFRQNNIRRVRLYDPNQAALNALKNTGIEVIVGVPNSELRSLTNPSSARSWLQNNVLNYYPAVSFKYIAVGNEVSPSNGGDVVLPAMRNVYDALRGANLQDRIKVSTAVDMTLIGNSFPPSSGEFRGDVRWYIDPIIGEDNEEGEREQICRIVERESDPDYNPAVEESDSEYEDYEEVMERSHFEVENAVALFNDELSIQHNEYPDSDSDSEDVVFVAGNKRERMIRGRGDGNLRKDQVFYSGVEFKEAVLDYALKEGRNIKQCRWDQTKLAYKCGIELCDWRIYASINKRQNIWEVKRFRNHHSCNRNGHCEMLTDPVIARLFLDKIRQEPDYMMPMKIQAMIKEQWKLVATRNQCQEARNKALRWIKKEYEDQFAHIRGYCKEITDSNKDSTVALETIEGPEGEDLFDRFYVCFDILRRSWKETCRPLIGVDGTFLKGPVKGQLLVAIGRDASNKMYPLAWAVVQVENEKNWLWFIKMVKSDLDLKDGDGYIITSDRQKGLIKAVEMELPKAEHRKCVRHIYGNLKAKHGKKMEMKPFIWNLAWSYNETDYEKNLQRLRDYDEGVYNDVMLSNPRSWCRAFYKIDGNCCEDVENNTVESFNNSIGKAREKHIMPMLETIRRLAMKRISVRKAIANKHPAKFTPYVQDFLDAQHEDASKCTIWPGTTGRFEVDIFGKSERVDMTHRKCTCCKWNITGIPCEHAYGVILEFNLNSDDYVSDWFLTSRWRGTYNESMIPLRGPGHWARGDIALVSLPPEPLQPGRKKKSKKQKRVKGVNESPSKKKKKNKNKNQKEKENSLETKPKRTMHCKQCGGAGHNSRSCAKRAKRAHNDASGSQSTQVHQA